MTLSVVIASASEAIQNRESKNWIASELTLLAMTENNHPAGVIVPSTSPKPTR